MSKGIPRCDTCDPQTRQLVGCYHARPECQSAAAKYVTSETVLVATFVHPGRCGLNQELCDAGLFEPVA